MVCVAAKYADMWNMWWCSALTWVVPRPDLEAAGFCGTISLWSTIPLGKWHKDEERPVIWEIVN